MRLINAISLEIMEFFDSAVPKYAILSHTWGDDEMEVSFSDFRRGDPLTKAKPGYQKIENACKEALKRNLHYVWVDTCCIDKTSSAELSEAINSMFQWYEEAEICFAYLVDATSAAALEPSEASRWFTRGWTLQELLAPSKLEFFDNYWCFIASRHDAAEAISLTTGIDQVFLTDTYVGSRRKLLASASGATKMSWAAQRKTKRKEDIAYCLLGIFDVNMPLIYGEGMRAFTRLQQEILRSSFDPTLLAWNRADLVQFPPDPKPTAVWSTVLGLLLGEIHPWRSGHRNHVDECPMGLLASSPAQFRHCRNITAHGRTCDWNFRSQGLEVTLPMSEDQAPYAMIPCHLGDNPTKLLALPLEEYALGVYLRSNDELRIFNYKIWQRWPKKKIMLRLTTTEDFENQAGNYTKGSKLWIRNIPPSLMMVDAYHVNLSQSVESSLKLRPCHLSKENPLTVLAGTQNGRQTMAALLLRDKTSGISFAMLIGVFKYRGSFNSIWSLLRMGDTERLVCRYLKSVSPAQLTRELQLLSFPQFDLLPTNLRHEGVLCLHPTKMYILGQKTWALDINLLSYDPQPWVARCGQWFKTRQPLPDAYFNKSSWQFFSKRYAVLLQTGLIFVGDRVISQLIMATLLALFSITVTFLVQWAWKATSSIREEYFCAACCPSLCSTEWMWMDELCAGLLSLPFMFPMVYWLLPMVSYFLPQTSDFIKAKWLILASLNTILMLFLIQKLISDIHVILGAILLFHIWVLLQMISYHLHMRRPEYPGETGVSFSIRDIGKVTFSILSGSYIFHLVFDGILEWIIDLVI